MNFECKKGDNGLWGYVDAKNKWVIEPQFEDAWDFQEGLGRVKLNGKQGFIKPDGTYMIEPIFRFAWDFNNGLSYIRINGEHGGTKDGVLKKDGTYLIEPLYDLIKHYIDEKGNSCTGLEIKDGLIHVTMGEGKTRKEGWLREDGTLLLAPDKYTYCGPFVNGFCKIWSVDNEKYGVFSREGKVVAEPQFDSVTFVGNGAVIVKNDGRYGLVNQDGEYVLPIGCVAASSLGEGVIKYKTPNSDKYGVASAKGVLKEPQYDSVCEFKDGAALVELDGLYGYLKPDGTYLFEPKFVKAGSMSNRKAEVMDGRQRGIAYADGKIDFEKAIFRKKGDNGKWGFVDKNDNWVVEPIYLAAWDSREQRAIVVNDDELCGFIDTEGNVVVPFEYDDVTNFYGGHAVCKIDDEGVVVDKKGECYDIEWDFGIDELDIDSEPGSSITLYGPVGIEIDMTEVDSFGRSWVRNLFRLVDELKEDEEDWDFDLES